MSDGLLVTPNARIKTAIDGVIEFFSLIIHSHHQEPQGSIACIHQAVAVTAPGDADIAAANRLGHRVYFHGPGSIKDHIHLLIILVSVLPHTVARLQDIVVTKLDARAFAFILAQVFPALQNADAIVALVKHFYRRLIFSDYHTAVLSNENLY